MPALTNLGHIDRALTNISVAYMQGTEAFIADKVFPIVPVVKQSDVYFQYSKADMFRDEVQERGRGAESVGGDFNIKIADPYYCRKYAYHYDITKEEKVNYDRPLDVDRDAAFWLSEKMLLKRELDFANKFFKENIWATNIAGKAYDNTTPPGTNEVVKWSSQYSDPVVDINNAMLHMAENTGKKPNFMIMAPDVFYALKNHEDIMDRIKYTQKGIITLDLIASLFEVDKIYIPWGIVNSGPQTPKYDDTKDTMSFIYKGKVLLGYRANRPSLREATAGYIFAWTGLEGATAYGSRVVRLPMDHLGLGTERIEMEMAYDQKLICADMGIFFKDLV